MDDHPQRTKTVQRKSIEYKYLTRPQVQEPFWQIDRRKFHGQQGLWNKYVEEHLLPRLNGFESAVGLFMASYAIIHLKMDLLLTETGFQPTSNQRLKVYLTKTRVEEFHQDTGTLFANWLSTEANEANHIYAANVQ